MKRHGSGPLTGRGVILAQQTNVRGVFQIIQENIGQCGFVPGHQLENRLGAGMAIALVMAEMMPMECIEILSNASQCRNLGVLWPRWIESNLRFFLIEPMALSFRFLQRIR